ncbi:hypothetical protein FGO68_gene13329 [Halteria grandinella]|uniref:Uncharacterized protein n=1 Tax=Halteria grandinella TaxID=5974 RepID=A0A8J8T228_HALGN|nr:hypothetical protein FGO68_gene13329 [Halteria grandinella]
MMIRVTRENEAEVERMRGGKGRKETVLGGGANFMPQPRSSMEVQGSKSVMTTDRERKRRGEEQRQRKCCLIAQSLKGGMVSQYRQSILELQGRGGPSSPSESEDDDEDLVLLHKQTPQQQQPMDSHSRRSISPSSNSSTSSFRNNRAQQERLARLQKWNFKKKFRSIDRYHPHMEVNPLINHQAIDTYIKRAFHYTAKGGIPVVEDDEEAVQRNRQRIKELLKETQRRKEKVRRLVEDGVFDKYMNQRGGDGGQSEETYWQTNSGGNKVVSIPPLIRKRASNMQALYNRDELYSTIKKMNYSQIFSGLNDLHTANDKFQELKSLQNFDQAQVVKDVLDYLDFDINLKDKEIQAKRDLYSTKKLKLNATLPKVKGNAALLQGMPPAVSVISPRIQRMVGCSESLKREKKVIKLFSEQKKSSHIA